MRNAKQEAFNCSCTKREKNTKERIWRPQIRRILAFKGLQSCKVTEPHVAVCRTSLKKICCWRCRERRHFFSQERWLKLGTFNSQPDSSCNTGCHTVLLESRSSCFTNEALCFPLNRTHILAVWRDAGQ